MQFPFTNLDKLQFSDTQAYKQFGNSVAITVVECIASKMLQCLTKEATQKYNYPKLWYFSSLLLNR
jgi:site-specific DNA-cytosine methylase